MIVRHFTFGGKQIGAFLPRSAFPRGLPPGYIGDGPSIQVTPDRVGVLVDSGTSGSKHEWVELDLTGRIVERVNTRSPAFVALTTDDHVYLKEGRLDAPLLTLDSASHSWKPVPNGGFTLAGADGTKLVFARTWRGAVELYWFDQPLAPDLSATQ
jgi:hypothetical protein